MSHVRYALEWIVQDAVKNIPKDGIWVEVGAGVGTGIACMSRHLIDQGRDDVKLYCVDPFMGTARCGEQTRVLKDPGYHGDWRLFLDMMEKHAPEELRRISILRLTSVQAARALANEKIDLCIIDGDHSERGITQDLDAWTPLIREGGCVGFDDMVADSAVELAVLGRFGSRVERRGNPHSDGGQADWPTGRVSV